MVIGNLGKRVISASILIPIVLYIIYVGGLVYNSFIIMGCILMAYEWGKLVEYRQKWLILGVLYIFPAITFLLAIRDQSYYYTLWVFLFVWATDIGGYVFGKFIGGPKIAPQVSPNKTHSGLIGCIIFSTLLTYFFTDIFLQDHKYLLVSVSPVLAIICQLGDLLESWVKRKFGQKDSGALIPGHGGLLDRVDGFAFFVPIAFLIY